VNKIKIAVIGYGNIGKYAVEAVQAAPDMELAGVVSKRNVEAGTTVTNDIKNLGHVDAAILCPASRDVPEFAEKYLGMGINTVDSFDIHSSIADLRQRLMPVAKKNGAVSVISAGWDPGSDSVVRALLEAIAPNGITYTDFGPGMSMGHTVAAKAVKGVKNALSLTIPLGSGVHRRVVYTETEPGADFGDVERAIKADDYFAHDETHVRLVKDVNALIDMGHGVHMTRKGVSGKTHNQNFSFDMKITNPALTAQVMAACARASKRLAPGAYTMIEIPVIDMICGERDEIVRRLV